MLLRDVEANDLPHFFEHQQDAEANRMAAFPPRDWDAFTKHWRETVLTETSGVRKTVVVDGAVAGYVLSWAAADGARLVGYWIARSHWGRGLATEALSAFLRSERTRPLRAYVASRNAGSIRVLQKCGFKEVHDDTSAETDERSFVLEQDLGKR